MAKHGYAITGYPVVTAENPDNVQGMRHPSSAARCRNGHYNPATGEDWMPSIIDAKDTSSIDQFFNLFFEAEPFAAILIDHGTHGCSEKFI